MISNQIVSKEFIIEHFYRISKKFGVVCLESRISESFDYILTQDLIDSSIFLESDVFFPVFWQPVNEDLTIDDFRPVRMIGKGGFSFVVLCRKLDTGLLYAIKCLKLGSDPEDLIKISTEVEIMNKLDHPFIIRLQYFFRTQNMAFIVSDFCCGGELSNYMKKFGPFNEECAKFYFCEVLMALEYLHDLNVVYRDLKPENILIDHLGHIRIIDFGLSKQLGGKHGVTFSFCGSPRYLSPEMLQGDIHGKPVDFYSLGIFLYDMLTGSIPQLNDSRILKTPENLSKACKNLLDGLLKKYPEDRLGYKRGTEEIKSHKWLKNIDWKKVYNKIYKPPINPISRESNFPLFTEEEDFLSSLKSNPLNFPDKKDERLEEFKDSATATSESKKPEEKIPNILEDPSYVYSSSIDNSLMINQIPTFLTKFLL
jgi:serine/threonine protein kinase